jgi:8-oxo-dGTP pyrophosphatase MutT (NUDIX family)
MRTQVVIRCIVIKDDSILLCKNIAGNFYFFPGGGLELGETINECIIREIDEEMGIAEKDVKIHDDSIFVIENHIKDSNGKALLDENGKPAYEIDIVKKVDINSDKIESKEDHIDFDLVKVSDIRNTILYPEILKKWVINNFDKKGR